MKTILLTGGGTGGHVIPHLSLLPHLKKHFDKIYYIGTKTGIEKEIILNQTNIPYFEISASKLIRDKKSSILTLPFKVLKSICQAKKILKKLKPTIVFSKGGYVSVPVCIAAKLLKIPVVSHESDLTLGLANKINYKVCTKFLTTFESTSKNLKKAVFTGAPIRQQLFSGSKENAKKFLNLNSTKRTILFIGGSTGALNLNKTIYSALPNLTQRYNVVHIVGKNKGDPMQQYQNYTQLEYCHNIEDVFSITDLVVSRAGSNAIFEFLALKLPMLLIPLPKKASRGDQIDNANFFKQKQFAQVIFEESLTPQILIKQINNLDAQKQKYITNMSAEKNKYISGTKNILNELLKTLEK